MKPIKCHFSCVTTGKNVQGWILDIPLQGPENVKVPVLETTGNFVGSIGYRNLDKLTINISVFEAMNIKSRWKGN